MQKIKEIFEEKELFEKLVEKKEVDYLDLRYEKNRFVIITYSGKELEDIGVSDTQGGLMRVLDKGGFSTSSFNEIEKLFEAYRLARDSAGLASGNLTEPTVFCDVPVVEDEVLIKPLINPIDVSLKEKKELLENYNSMILGSDKVHTTKISYMEYYWDKVFYNSEGARIHQQQLSAQISGSIYSKKGDLIQQVRLTLGGLEDFSALLNRQDSVMKKVKMAQDLLEADPVKAGVYNVILDPDIAGVFIHEAFGHFSEADHLLHDKKLRDKMKLGRPLGKPFLNVIDDGTRKAVSGHYVYDDEGVASRKTYLIKDGILSGRLHSRKTARGFSEPFTGNTRAENYQFAPIVRMSNIFIDNGRAGFEDLLGAIKNGLYIKGAKGGQTMGDSFTFGAECGYKIENGKVAGMVRDLNLSGNLFSTLENVAEVGNDMAFSEGGGCGKGAQTLWKSGTGSPHILINDVVIGGK